MTTARFGRLTDPATTFLVAGARLVDPHVGRDEVADLGVVEGVVVAAGTVPSGAERIDGHGLLLLPGLCDLHAHLRDPGDAATETVESGTRAAARGGFTTVCAMPNTEPALDDPAAIGALLARAEGASARVRPIGAVTRGRGGGALADLEGMVAAGAVGVSDDGATVASAELAAEALARLAPLDRPLLQHAEDPDLAGDGVMRAGRIATRLGLRGWPEEAEVAIVERDLALAAQHGARIHLTHLSSARSIAAVRSARERGVRVTCDVTPHHLALTDAWVAGDRRFAWEADDDPRLDPRLAYDGACRVNPPLTSRADALALLEAVDDGTVDAIATDHAPHPTHRKLVPFDEAAPGLIGLETALSIGLLAVEAGRLTLPALVAALATRPAAIVGERRSLAVGEPADLVLVDPRARWTVGARNLASRSANTPLLGMELPGVVRLTVAGGRTTYRAGA